MQRTANPRMWVRFPPGPFFLPDQSGRIRLAFVSAAIHLCLLLLLLLPSAGSLNGTAPLSQEVALVFETGHPDVTAAPKSSLLSPSPPAQPTPEPPKAETEPPPAPPPPPPAPEPAAAIAPAAPAPTPPRAAPQEAALPVPLQTSTRPVASSAPTPAAPRLRRPAVSSAAAASGRFPTPLMQTWFIPSRGSARHSAFTRAAASSEEAAIRGARSENPYDIKGAEQLGSGWLNSFMEWVDQHKHYPEQAIANNEDGNSRVEFTVGRDGHVREVSLIQRSGSVWLDMGLTGLFRGARLPPFPYASAEQEVTISFTMHYILVR